MTPLTPDIAAGLTLGWQAWLTLGTVLGVFLLLAATRVPADFAFMGGLALLLVTGVLTPGEAFSGFASPGMITVAILYVVVAGLQATGGLEWVSVHVLGLPHGVRRAQLRLMAPVGLLSAFLNNTPIVAMFIPVVTGWCRRIGVTPSKLFMPLSYAAILGGVCTLIGTSTNLVVNGMYMSRYGGSGLGMFEITKVGLPIALIGVGYILLASRYLLPQHRSTIALFENPREYTIEVEVDRTSPMAGRTIEDAGLRRLPGAFLAELIRDGNVHSAVPPDETLQPGDRLVFVGAIDSVRPLIGQRGLIPAANQLFKLDAPRHQRCLVEAVVSDTCPLAGKSIREGRFRNHYNAVVIAVARNGKRVSGKIGDIVLRAGDTLLIESHEGFIPRQRDSRDFYLVSAVADSTPHRFERAPIAFIILMLMVAAVASGVIPILNAALIAAAFMIILRCCSVGQARRAIEWHVLIVIAAALGLGAALDATGAARAMANTLLSLTGAHPWRALILVYLVTVCFTELITNNAAAALVFPIAMNTAERLAVNPLPFAICIMIAASASFITPIGYQTNLMVYGPGSYRFGDYMRFGLPLSLVVGCAAILLTPLIWPF